MNTYQTYLTIEILKRLSSLTYPLKQQQS